MGRCKSLEIRRHQLMAGTLVSLLFLLFTCGAAALTPEEAFQQPVSFKEAMDMMKDPNVMNQLREMMQDPAFQAQMETIQNDPSFLEARQAAMADPELRKWARENREYFMGAQGSAQPAGAHADAEEVPFAEAQ